MRLNLKLEINIPSYTVINGGLDSLFGKLYAILNCSLVGMLWTVHFAVFIKKKGTSNYEYSDEESMYLQMCLRIIDKPTEKNKVSFSIVHTILNPTSHGVSE